MPPRKKKSAHVSRESSRDRNPFQSSRSRPEDRDIDISDDEPADGVFTTPVRHRRLPVSSHKAPVTPPVVAPAPPQPSPESSYTYMMVSLLFLVAPLLLVLFGPPLHCLLGPLLPSPRHSQWTAHCPYAIPPVITNLFSTETESSSSPTLIGVSEAPLATLPARPPRVYHPILSHLATKTPFLHRPPLPLPASAPASPASGLPAVRPLGVSVLARHGSREMTADHAQRAMRAFLAAAIDDHGAASSGHALRLLGRLSEPSRGRLTAHGRREAAELGLRLGREWAAGRGAVDPEGVLGTVGVALRAEIAGAGQGWCASPHEGRSQPWGSAWEWLPAPAKTAVWTAATHKHRARETRAAAVWGLRAGVCVAGQARGAAAAEAATRSWAVRVPDTPLGEHEEDAGGDVGGAAGPVVEMRATLADECPLRLEDEDADADGDGDGSTTVSGCVWRRASMRFFEECGASVLRPKRWAGYSAAVEAMLGAGVDADGGMSDHAAAAVSRYCAMTGASEAACARVRALSRRAEAEVDALLWSVAGAGAEGPVQALARHLGDKLNKKAKKAKKGKKDKELKASTDKAAKKDKKLRKVLKALEAAGDDGNEPAGDEGVAAARAMVLGWVRRLCEGDAGAGRGADEDGWCALLGGAQLQAAMATMPVGGSVASEGASEWGSGRGPSAVLVLLEHLKDVKARWKKGPQGGAGIGAACSAVRPLLGIDAPPDEAEAEAEAARVSAGWAEATAFHASAEGTAAAASQPDLAAAVLEATHRGWYPCPLSGADPSSDSVPDLTLPAHLGWCRVRLGPPSRVSLRVAHAETLLPVLALLDPAGLHADERGAGDAEVPPAVLHEHPVVARGLGLGLGEARGGAYYLVGSLTPMAARVAVWRFGGVDGTELLQLRVNGDAVPWPCAKECSEHASATSPAGELLKHLCPNNTVKT